MTCSNLNWSNLTQIRLAKPNLLQSQKKNSSLCKVIKQTLKIKNFNDDFNDCFRVAQQSNEAYNLEEREEFTEIESLLLSGR